MKNPNIINAFEFLIDEYHCQLLFENTMGNHYLFQNDLFKLKIYVWEQFNEVDINLIYNMENYHIDPFLEEPYKMSLINKKRKGMKKVFYNYDKDFWILVSEIIKNKIKQLNI